jgi:HlyD family secretion protein
MKNRKRVWLVVILVLALGGAGFYLLTNNRQERITYRFDKVTRGDVLVAISATGTLQAVTTVAVGSQVSGTIARLYADFNTVVKEGQLLAQLDPTFLQASVNEQRANVTRAQAQVNEAQRSFDRTRDLSAKSLVSQADLDAATTTLESAKAGMSQAAAALDRAEVNLRYATIRAPIGGVVISRSVDVGQTVAASLQAPTLFTIANDLRKMQVQASVDEADIGGVKPGQMVKFRVDSYPEHEFPGVVSQVRLAPVVAQNVVTYTVVIDVENPDQKLMPGMTATVSIEVAKAENSLRVPIQAIRFTPLIDTSPGEKVTPSGRSRGDSSAVRQMGGPSERRIQRNPNTIRVWVMKDGKPVPVRAVKGIQNTQFVVVRETDLQEGDEIITGVLGTAQSAASAGQSPFQPQRVPGGGRRGGM